MARWTGIVLSSIFERGVDRIRYIFFVPLGISGPHRAGLPGSTIFSSGNENAPSHAFRSAHGRRYHKRYGLPRKRIALIVGRLNEFYSMAHLSRTLPQVNPAPNADKTTQSPFLSRFSRYASDMARGMVAAVVLPYRSRFM